MPKLKPIARRKTGDGLDSLEKALSAVIYPDPKKNCWWLDAKVADAALRSAVRATVPGRQQKRNLEPLLKMARAAFVRTLRRRARG